TIKSKKKLHLACHTMPTVLEEMGVTMDEIDGIGHWASNTCREVYAAKIPKSAVVALAGFYVGEAYHVPWAGVPVPDKLQTKLFPFVENVLANLKAEPWVNQGVVNFLELLQQLRPFFWRVSAAIYEHFPDCSLFCCMKVFACPDARNFLEAWPGLVSGTEHELEAEAAVAAMFSEANTQTAFMSLAARQKEFETSLCVQTAQLNVLTHHTEPLSPSYKRSGEEQAHQPDPQSLPSSLCTHCRHHGTPDRSNNHLLGHLNKQFPMASSSAAPSPTVMPTSADPVGAGAGISLHPSVDTQHHTPVLPAGNDLCVVPINAHSLLFHVLRLSPGLTAPPTPFDIILPSAVVFCDGADKLEANQAQYPKFTPAGCGWHAIFEHIAWPALLWDCWGPGSLGEYPDILALWKSWDKGLMVKGVGQRLPLCLMDARWGCHTDVCSRKGHLPAWQPRNNENARQKWSQYQFFTRCIEESVANGRTALQAVHELDNLRGSRTLPQLHQELQPK
ncbi:hypothetical protein V8E53_015271, partial [Lactarius tabidus]